MKYLVYITILSLAIQVNAQKVLEGKVMDNNGVPMIGANVFIKGTYSGTVTNDEGYFNLKSISDSDSLLVISFVGYQRKEIPIKGSQISFNIKLEELTNTLDEVRITAGSFEASEENRAVMLDPIDIATTASSDADIYGALSTFPGAQKQGESGELIVRGGDASETKTYIDGMLVSSPYRSSMPDLPSRGRFTPFMFNGVMFSTGGYSAEYGQALSSVLELQTPGTFDEDITSISLMNAYVGTSLTRKGARSAVSSEFNYFNSYPYFAMATHDLNWKKIPQTLDGKLFLRKKAGKTGLIKTDLFMNCSKSELDNSNLDSEYNMIGLYNDNQFIKTTYNSEINKKWMIKTGVAFNRNLDVIDLDNDELKENLNTSHIKFSLVHYLNDNITIKGGTDLNYLDYHFQYKIDSNAQNIKLDVEDFMFAGYLESDVKLSKKLALRLGARAEHSTFIEQQNIAPRVSMAYKLSKSSQVSLALGQFYQLHSIDYLKYTDQLDFKKAQHILINYQYQKGYRIFRTEIYHKEYDHLITYVPGLQREYDNIGNVGYGYAQGIDIFWKDDETFENTSYWISYSYINSERKYKDYIQKAVPNFVSPHNISVACKYWWEAITTRFAATYTFSGGRSYYNPNNDNFMADRTPAIHDLSANASYVTDLIGAETIVHLSVSNLLGQEHIYSYKYSEVSDAAGIYEARPVKNYVRRTIIIGILISFN